MSTPQEVLKKRMQENTKRILKDAFQFHFDNDSTNMESPTPKLVNKPEPTSMQLPDIYPESETRKALREKLSTAPTPEQFQPSKKRRILAGIAGGLQGAARGAEEGAKLSTGILEAPYREKVQQYEAEVNPLLKQAELEKEDIQGRSNALSGLASYLRAHYDSPEMKALSTQLSTQAEESIKQPGRIELEDKRRKAANELETQRQTGRERLSKEEAERRKGESAEERASRERIAAANIASREKLAARNAELRRELTTTKAKTQRVPVNQQIEARYDAEDRLLRGLTDKEVIEGGLSADELAEITDQIITGVTPANPNGRVRYVLKPKAKVKKEYQKIWESYSSKAKELADETIGNSFNPFVGEENEEDETTLDDEWEEF